MQVSITDYTPSGRALDSCTSKQLLETMHAISRHGELRMHAECRLMCEIESVVRGRGLGVYEYPKGSRDEWEAEVGVRWSIAQGSQTLKDTDHHEAIACDIGDSDLFTVFVINGPLTKARKKEISRKMKEKKEREDVRQAAWRAKEAELDRKNPGRHGYIITGMCL